MQIYLLQAGEQTGPFTEDEIRGHLANGSLLSDTPAWREGMESWAPLGELFPAEATEQGNELVIAAPKAPPPLPQKPKASTSNTKILIYTGQALGGLFLLYLGFWIIYGRIAAYRANLSTQAAIANVNSITQKIESDAQARNAEIEQNVRNSELEQQKLNQQYLQKDLDRVDAMVSRNQAILDKLQGEKAPLLSKRNDLLHEFGVKPSAIGDDSPSQNSNADFATNPQSADDFTRLGALKSGEGDFSAAISAFNKALNIDPSDEEAYVGRGFAFQSTAHPQEAIKDFDQAISIDPNSARAYAYRARVEYTTSDSSKAGSDLVKANEAYYKVEQRLNDEIRGLKYQSTAAFFADFVSSYKRNHPDYDRVALLQEYFKTSVNPSKVEDPLNKALQASLDGHLSNPTDPWVKSADPLVAVQNEGWSSSFFTTSTNGKVADVWQDGKDLIIVGDFTTAGGVACNRIARWDGKNWFPVGRGLALNSIPTCVAKYKDQIFIGASFGLCRIAQNGAQVDIPIDGGVSAFAVTSDGLYLAGSFTKINSVPASRVAFYDGTNFQPLGDGIFGGAATVNCITPYGNGVLAGGSFTSAGKVEARSLAVWQNGDWSAFPASLPGTDATVNLLSSSGNKLLMGGFFKQVPVVRNGKTSPQDILMMQYDGNAWTPVDFLSDPYASGNENYRLSMYRQARKPTAIAADGNGWVVAVEPVRANHFTTFIDPLLWRWDGQSMSPINALTSGGRVSKLVSTPGGLVVSGEDFAGATSVVTVRSGVVGGEVYSQQMDDVKALPIFPEGILQIRNNAIVPMGEGEGLVDAGRGGTAIVRLAAYGKGFCLATKSSDVTAGNARSGGVIYYDGATWHPTDPQFKAFGENAASGVESLSTYQGNIVASALFEGPSMPNFWGVATYVNDAWAPLGQQMKFQIKAFAEFKGQLVATGDFRGAGEPGLGDQPLANIAVLAGNTWSPMGRGLTDGSGLALATSGDKLYVGGDFQHAGGVVAQGIAQWDGNQWTTLGDGFKGTVKTLCVDSKGTLYACGNMTWKDQAEKVSVAAWNGTTWTVVAKDCNVTKAVAWNGFLIVGGDFKNVDGVPVKNVAVFDGKTWKNLGSGCDNAVTDLALNGNQLMVGGDFSIAGDKAATNVSIYDLTKLATSLGSPSPQ